MALRVDPQDDALSVASSSLHDGAHTVCDLPATLRVPISERGRCLPHMKQDMVAPPNDAAAANGDPALAMVWAFYGSHWKMDHGCLVKLSGNMAGATTKENVRVRSCLIEWNTTTALSRHQRQGTDLNRKRRSKITVKPVLRRPSASPLTPL